MRDWHGTGWDLPHVKVRVRVGKGRYKGNGKVYVVGVRVNVQGNNFMWYIRVVFNYL